MKLSRFGLVLGTGFSVLFIGCSQEQGERFEISSNVLELEPRQLDKFSIANPPRLVDQLVSNDVIVAVNGYPLTKQTFVELMKLKAMGILSDGKKDERTATKELDEYRKGYPKMFISQRLLIDDAFTLGVVDTNMVAKHVAKVVIDAAKRRKTSVAKWLKRFNGSEKYFYYEVAASFVMSKLIKERIPPRCEVTHSFVTNVQAIVQKQNEAVRKTNVVYRAQLTEKRTRLMSGELDFASATNQFCQVDEFTKEDLPNEIVATTFFATPKGMYSDIQEDDESYLFAKVLDVAPAERDATGELISQERRKLAVFYKLKDELMEEDGELVLTRDLQNQMQLQALDRYVMRLLTNGVNRVEYPNGNKLFN